MGGIPPEMSHLIFEKVSNISYFEMLFWISQTVMIFLDKSFNVSINVSGEVENTEMYKFSSHTIYGTVCLLNIHSGQL